MKNKVVLRYAGEVDEDRKIWLWRLTELMVQVPDVFKGKKFVLSIEEYKVSKTLPQLGYLFAAVYPTAMSAWKQLGEQFSMEQVRYILESEAPMLKETFLVNNTPVTRQIHLSDADMTKELMSEYIDWAIRFIAEQLGVAVPPSEDYFAGNPKPLDNFKSNN